MNVSVVAATREHLPALVGLMRDFYAGAPVAFNAHEAATSFTRLIEHPALGAAWLAHVDGSWPVMSC